MIYFKKISSFFLSKNLLTFLACLPFLVSFSYLWKIPLGKLGSVNFLDILLLIFLGYSLFFILRKNFFSDFKAFYQENYLLAVLLGVFLFFSFLSALNNPSLWDGLGLWKSFFFLPIVFVWFLIFWKRNALLQENFILKSLWYCAVFIALGGLYFWLNDKLSYDKRLSFIFSSPNHLALTLSPALFVGLEKLLFFWKKQQKNSALFTLLGLLLILFSLWQTRSLGLFIFLPGTFLISLLLYKKRVFLLYFLFFYLIFNLSLLFSWSPLLKNLHYNPHIPPDSTDSRIVIWQVTEKIISQHWLEGVGLGNFQNTYLAYQKNFPPYPQWAVPHAHNLFFHLWAELGALNLIFFIFLLFCFFAFQQKNPSGLFSSLLLFFLIYGLAETSFWKNDLALLFWFVLLFGQINPEKSPTQPVNEK